MSVRRLAEDNIQPAGFAFNKANSAAVKKRIAMYPEDRQQSAVIPILMLAQDQEGWVSRPAIEEVARMLEMPYIRVLEVATFYTQFQLQPVGSRAHIQVCGTTPCMLRGAEDIRGVCQARIHNEAHHLSADGTLSWEEVECLGACVNAPMVAIGDETYEDLTPERMEEIIDAFAAGKGDSVKPGPQIDRTWSAPVTGFTSLTETGTAKGGRRTTGKPANDQEPTKKGKKAEITEEAAPGVEGPNNKAKVSRQKAETGQKDANTEAAASGKGTGGTKTARSGGAKSTTSGAAGPIFSAPTGEPDDLKLISGVGPVLGKKLNALGVVRFDQIASFKKADIGKLDDALSFKGRIERDGWVKQARALTKGIDEYVRVFGKKPR